LNQSLEESIDFYGADDFSHLLHFLNYWFQMWYFNSDKKMRSDVINKLLVKTGYNLQTESKQKK